MIKISVFGIVVVSIIVLLRKHNPEVAIAMTIASGVIILNYLLPQLHNIFVELNNIVKSFKMNTMYINTLLKIIGIAYISEFASQICIDAGETAIASKIELGGKVLIMTLSIPILNQLLTMINSILN